jgi:hypothetical protein
MLLNATVWSSKATDLLPGGLAEIIYSYSHQGNYLSDTHEKQFLSYSDAVRYSSALPLVFFFQQDTFTGLPAAPVLVYNRH